MIPPAIAEAAREGKWLVSLHYQMTRTGNTWITLSHIGKGVMVDIRRDRWRHTTARAFRGRSLTAVLKGQKAIAEYLCT